MLIQKFIWFPALANSGGGTMNCGLDTYLWFLFKSGCKFWPKLAEYSQSQFGYFSMVKLRLSELQVFEQSKPST